MTIIADTLLTFDAKGLNEDLSDVIYNISPEDTPLVSMIAKETTGATLFEWQTDTLAAVDGGNAQLEGDEIADANWPSVAVTTRVGNYTQISRKLLMISGTQEVVNKAGRQSEIAYQTAKRGAEMKRDIETIIFANAIGVAGNGTTARVSAGLGAWVKSNVDKGSGGTDPTWTTGVPNDARNDGTLRDITETILKSAISKVWTAGGELKFMFVGPWNKAVVSGFSGVATKNYDLSGKPRPTAIIGAADVYVSDFGYLSILPSRWSRERDGWLIDPEYLALVHLRPFARKEIATTGDALKRMLIVEWGLKVRTEAAMGLCADISTT